MILTVYTVCLWFSPIRGEARKEKGWGGGGGGHIVLLVVRKELPISIHCRSKQKHKELG